MSEAVTIHGVSVDPEKYRKFIIPFERKNRSTGKTTTTEYLNVEGKLALLRDMLVALGHASTDYSVETLDVQYQGKMIWVSKRLRLPWGSYDSVSGANSEGSDIAAGSPFEVADTSALGRCIGHAGIDILGKIESADGMSKAGYNEGGSSGGSTRSSASTSRGSDDFDLPIPEPNDGEGGYCCDECEAPIKASKNYTAPQLAALSVKRFKRVLCWDHGAGKGK